MSLNVHPGSTNGSSEVIVPIERLPTELLQEIFKKWTMFQDIHDVGTIPEPGMKDSPLVFTRVSKRWGTAATTCCDLWSSIRVADEHLPHGCDDDRLPSFCAMLEKWLRYSNNRPLDVVLQGQYDAKRTIWDAIIPVLSRHAHHFASLIAPSALIEKIFDQQVDMPMLRHFDNPDFTYNLARPELRVLPAITELRVARLLTYLLIPPDGARELRRLECGVCRSFADLLRMLRHFPNFEPLG